MRFAVLPHHPSLLTEFDAWCEGRKYSKYQRRGDSYIWVAVDAGDGTLIPVSGVCLHFSTQFLLVQDFVIAPGTHPKVAHNAALLTIDHLKSICVSRSVVPLVHTVRRSIARMLMKKGFMMTQHTTLLLPEPTVNRWVQPKRRPEPKPKPRRTPRRRKAKSV